MDYRFLPAGISCLKELGWYWYDFLLITGDAYVDHPSFGAAVIGRVLEADGYRVAVLSQPDWQNADDFKRFGRPRLGVLVTSGNIDSMVAHYTVFKKPRGTDSYSPGGMTGKRPDRAVIAYANRAREAFGDIPVILGGLEASLRRFAHYDYWQDKVRRSVLIDSGADLLVFGMGERPILEIARRLKSGAPVSEITDIRGVCYLTADYKESAYPFAESPSYELAASDKRAYAEAAKIQYDEHDPVRGRAVVQKHGDIYLVQNPPAAPLSRQELDKAAELPYTREYHPMYEPLGGVPAIEEVKFSLIHNRGCFGGCNFCSLAFHQGRMVTSRSHESLIREAKKIRDLPGFKGYIHDVGGPTANFRSPSCALQLKKGMCKDRNCLSPEPCKNLKTDHSDYLSLLRKLRSTEGIKKVFIRSGIRFDYLMHDRDREFFSELVKHHVSGQLKVAPEHCSPGVLQHMSKPDFGAYIKFSERFKALNEKHGKRQFLVPYLMSSHPGCTLHDAIALAEYLNKNGMNPEQVQDFYPTPGTISTCMYYAGIDPRTMKTVYVAPAEEKAMQRALLQWRRPEKRALVKRALIMAGREDLIGFGKRCLIRPDYNPGAPKRIANLKAAASGPARNKKAGKGSAHSKTEKKRTEKKR